MLNFFHLIFPSNNDDKLLFARDNADGCVSEVIADDKLLFSIDNADSCVSEVTAVWLFP